MTWKTETCGTCEFNVDGHCRALPCRNTWARSVKAHDDSGGIRGSRETVRHVCRLEGRAELDFYQVTEWPDVSPDTDACGMWKERRS
jgi:hypothetical protein